MFVKSNGEQCQGHRLTADGLQRMVDAGFDLVADPEQFCSYHARTEAERYEMQSRGGSYSQKRAAEVKAEKLQAAWEARETIPRELVVAQQQLVSGLLTAKLPGTRETDVRRACVGAYLAAHLYAQPDDHEKLLQQLTLHVRQDALQIAQDELHDMIEELAPDQREAVWEMLATAP